MQRFSFLSMSTNLLDCYKDKNQEIRSYAENYLQFIRDNHMDRERVNYTINLLQQNNFKKLELGSEENLQIGDKFYIQNKEKSLAFGIVGKNLGFTIIGSHADYPHLDLRPHFLKQKQSQGIVVLKTQNYGGIKRYNYATIPMILKVAFCDPNGKTWIKTYGDKPEHAVFTIPDLLVHLSSIQADRKCKDVLKPREMVAIAGSSCGEFSQMKDNFINLLYQEFGLVEADYQFAEFQLYPAIPARYVGLDKSMIGGPGQDDGICCYAGLQALLKIKDTPSQTCLIYFSSYEETGSFGCAGAQSGFLRFALEDLLYRLNVPQRKFSSILSSSFCISADVTSAYDVNFEDAHDGDNAASINRGVGMNRFTGSGGKSGSSEAPAELMAKLRGLINDDKLFQISIMGEIEVGGGGTIARYMSQLLNCEVIDIGVALLNMHSPFEISGIADLWACIEVYNRLMK